MTLPPAKKSRLEISKVFPRRRNIFIILFLAAVVGGIVQRVWGVGHVLVLVWNITWEAVKDFFTKHTVDSIVAFIAGVGGGLVLTMIQKGDWTTGEGKRISDELESLRSDHRRLLGELPGALGGQFTKSLLQFHPDISRKIADIISTEVDRQYRQYYKKVVVISARDVFQITRLKPINVENDRPWVWEMNFFSSWLWENDSHVRKSPLKDLMIVVAAPSDVVDSFVITGAGMSETQRTNERTAARDEFTEFFSRHSNIVRSIVVNPVDPLVRIPSKALETLFHIESVSISGESLPVIPPITADRLIRVKNVPRGVYAAYMLPFEELVREYTDARFEIAPGERLSVEYKGVLCKQAGDGNGFTGFISFPPSDVIGDQYSLDLLYPNLIHIPSDLGERQFRIQVNRKESGCQFLHDPISAPPDRREARPDDIPIGFETDGQQISSIYVEESLTSLHNISMVWNAYEILTKKAQPA